MRCRSIAFAVLVALFTVGSIASAQPASDAAPTAAPTAPPDTGPTAAPTQTTLQVYTKPIEPFAYQRDDKALGFSIDLWNRIAAELGVKYELHWGKTVGELVDALKAKQADVAIAAISITSEREATVDFTTPYYESGLAILVKAQGKGAIDLIADTLWTRTVFKGFLVLVALLLVIAHLLWFFERNHNADQFPKPYLRGIWESSWWAISTILSGGCDAKGPMVVIGRIIGAVWMLVCIIVITYFTAAITTVMTVSELTSDINGPNDLPGKKVATVKGSTAEKYLLEHGAKVSGFATIDEAYAALDKNDVIAVVYDQPILAYHAKTMGGSKEKVVGLFERQNYGIGLQESSPYRKPINTILLRLAEEGVIDELRVKWFGDDI